MTTFTPNKYNDVKTIRPDWDVPGKVKVFSTTRLGGVSQAPFDSLNIGSHVNDNPQHVQKNRALVVEAIEAPAEPLWLNQVHGRDVVFIDSFHKHDPVPAVDGTFTREPGQVLVIGTADCLPVVIANAQGTAVTVVHAGWRGLAAGILQGAMAHFHEDDKLHAWLGPAIGPEAFEVGSDVVAAFLKRDQTNARGFKPVGNAKFMADIYVLATLELKRLRPMHVTGGQHCTYTENELFHSHRRDGLASGRMATFAWIERPLD